MPENYVSCSQDYSQKNFDFLERHVMGFLRCLQLFPVTTNRDVSAGKQAKFFIS